MPELMLKEPPTVLRLPIVVWALEVSVPPVTRRDPPAATLAVVVLTTPLGAIMSDPALTAVRPV
jgi:hypothetical protein